MFPSGLKRALAHTVRMGDGGFLLPLPINKTEDFGSTIVRGRHNVCSVGAEAGTGHPARMGDGGFFLPLPINKPVDFGSTIVREVVTTCVPSGLKRALFTQLEWVMVAFSCHSPLTSP